MAKYQFLTEEWVAAAKDLREQFEGEAAAPAHVVRMNQIITGCPFEPSEVHTFMDTSDGTVNTGKGELDNAEVTLTTDWETSRKIIVEQDQAAAMQAFMSGKIKVAGDMTKLMAMQSGSADPVAEELAKKIAEITE